MQNNHYSNFYGDDMQNWSLSFPSERESHNFAMSVAIAKFMVSDQQSIIKLNIESGVGPVFLSFPLIML